MTAWQGSGRAPQSRTVGRRINAGQFAFLRAVILGIPLAEAADRYLAPGMDLRLVKRELRWLRGELLVAARRAHAFGDARALQIDMAQLPVDQTQGAQRQGLSLEDFRQSVDPSGDFYSEAELLELYREQYPEGSSKRRARRLERLRERQRRALDALQTVLVQPPQRDDAPSAWLDERVARRLEAVGLQTLGQLADWINQRGHLWHTVVPKLGAVGARRVVDWIERNGQDIGVSIDPVMQLSRAELLAAAHSAAPAPRPALPAALAPAQAPPSLAYDLSDGLPSGRGLVATPRPLLTQIVPLERLSVPADLDGSRGSNRAVGPASVAAQNDVDAVAAWVAAVAAGNPETARAYRREAERLILWSVFERGVPMASLTTEDAIAYRTFLSDPQPAERWVAQRSGVRLSPAWRPFRGPLSERSVAYAVTVVSGLFDWLVQQGYLGRNIWHGLPRRRTIHAAAEAEPDRLVPDEARWLSRGQWAAMRSVLAALGADEEAQRTRLVFWLAYTTGLRLSELAGARVGHLEALADDDGPGLADAPIHAPGARHKRRVVLRVRGKGNKLRTVPIVPQVEEQLDRYFALRGLPSWYELEGVAGEDKPRLSWVRGLPLIGQLRRASRRRQQAHAEGLEVTAEEEGGEVMLTPAGEPIDRRQAPLTPKRIYQIVQGAFADGQKLLKKQGHVRDAEVLARASTHWLRHTFGRHSLAGGVKINMVQALLGHASLQTTTRYTSDGGSEAWDAVEAFAEDRL